MICPLVAVTSSGTTLHLDAAARNPAPWAFRPPRPASANAVVGACSKGSPRLARRRAHIGWPTNGSFAVQPQRYPAAVPLHRQSELLAKLKRQNSLRFDLDLFDVRARS